MPVHQETNARFLVQVSIKSQNKRKSKRKLLWAEKSAKWRSRYSDNILPKFLTGKYSDILSNIFSGIHSGIYSCIPSGILSDTNLDLTSCLALYLAFSLARVRVQACSGPGVAHNILSSPYGVQVQVWPTVQQEGSEGVGEWRKEGRKDGRTDGRKEGKSCTFVSLISLMGPWSKDGIRRMDHPTIISDSSRCEPNRKDSPWNCQKRSNRKPIYRTDRTESRYIESIPWSRFFVPACKHSFPISPLRFYWRGVPHTKSDWIVVNMVPQMKIDPRSSCPIR